MASSPSKIDSCLQGESPHQRRRGADHGHPIPDVQRCRGFTLTEMLVALSILMFGLTAVAGSISMAVGTRRGSEMQLRAIQMVDRVVQDLRDDYLVRDDLEIGDPETGALLPRVAVEVPEFPGMKYNVSFSGDPESSRVFLARIQISWLEQGEDVAEVFERVLIREVPFSRRVSRLREANK